jgi:Zn-dependent metalloprotease
MCFIIPAHLYNNLLEKGTDEQKSFAHSALHSMVSFAEDKAAFVAGLIAGDAHESFIFGKKDTKPAAVKRSLYDAQQKMQLPGKLVRKEGDPSKGDVGVDEAYDGSGKTWDFFHKVFNRNSIDNKGMELVSTVHFGRNFANAFWDGKQMTYGDGDGKIFNRFTSVLDVVGHEISHGITERTAGLVYQDQPGALNEHFSDVFGALIKQYDRKQLAKDADWLIGEGLFTSRVEGRALRDMLNPGTAYDDERIGSDSQPNHMDRYVKTSSDNGGVHINSGIPNRAFATTAINLGGNSWDKAGQIWFKVLTSKLKSKSQFQDCVNATVEVAGELYGSKSVEQLSVVDGWKTVGLTPSVKL